MTRTMNTELRYYCANKFRFLKIDLESRTTYNCHAARPHAIDFAWLEKNPGQLFNTPINVHEREQMLRNERNASCEYNCWPAEDRGAPSHRLISGGQIFTHGQSITQPEIIDITVNTDCNLTCSYCCKEFSTSWRNDILQNGDYTTTAEPERYRANNMDKILSLASQTERFNTSQTKTILSEITQASTSARTIIISGGEPFLSKYLMDIVTQASHVPEIIIFTGLGVHINRFEKLLDALCDFSNVTLMISAETVGSYYEFNRYGMTWTDFEKKIDLLYKKNMRFDFSSVISNLTVAGFADFYRRFADHKIKFECVSRPDFLAPYVLDDQTKHSVIKQIESIDFAKKQTIIDSLRPDSSPQERKDLSVFLKEFVRRRSNISLSIFPSTFTQWIENVV